MWVGGEKHRERRGWEEGKEGGKEKVEECFSLWEKRNFAIHTPHLISILIEEEKK